MRARRFREGAQLSPRPMGEFDVASMRISVCRTGEQWSCFWSPSVEKLQYRPLSGCGGSNCLLCRGIYEVEGLSSSLILRSYFFVLNLHCVCSLLTVPCCTGVLVWACMALGLDFSLYSSPFLLLAPLSFWTAWLLLSCHRYMHDFVYLHKI